MSTIAPRSTRNQKACTSCRQVKLRCDSAQTFPAPCSRCQKNQLHCRTDPDFKRTRTRNRLAEVTNQLNAIQQTLALSPEQRNLLAASSGSESQSVSPAADFTNYDNNSDALANFYRYEMSNDLPSPPPYLGPIPIENSQIISLFEHFHKHYYRHCPILNTEISLHELHESSPLLFWTIIIISSRWHPSLHELYACFLDSYRALLSRALIEPQTSIEFVQAVILLLFWPLAVNRQAEDPSWNLCGMVTNVAMKLAIHRLRVNDRQGLSEKSAWIRRKTWLACVQANCSLGWNAGVAVSAEVLTSFGSPVLPHAKVDGQFILKVLVLRKLSQYTATVTALPDKLNSWAFVQNLCKDLDSVRDGWEEFWTTETEIVVLGAQLCLYTLQLEHAAKSLSPALPMVLNQDNDSARRNFIHLAFMAAARLIHLFSEMLPNDETVIPSDARSDVPQRYLPKHYFALSLLAMAFMYKVKILHFDTIKPNQNQINSHIRRIHEIFSTWSRESSDEPGRAIALMERVAAAEKESRLKLNDSVSDGRSGVKILEDMIDTGRAIREANAQKIETETDDSYDSSPMENLIASTTLPFEHQELLQGWNFPWGLDFASVDQYQFDVVNPYNM